MGFRLSEELSLFFLYCFARTFFCTISYGFNAVFFVCLIYRVVKKREESLKRDGKFIDGGFKEILMSVKLHLFCCALLIFYSIYKCEQLEPWRPMMTKRHTKILLKTDQIF